MVLNKHQLILTEHYSIDKLQTTGPSVEKKTLKKWVPRRRNSNGGCHLGYRLASKSERATLLQLRFIMHQLDSHFSSSLFREISQPNVNKK